MGRTAATSLVLPFGIKDDKTMDDEPMDAAHGHLIGAVCRDNAFGASIYFIKICSIIAWMEGNGKLRGMVSLYLFSFVEKTEDNSEFRMKNCGYCVGHFLKCASRKAPP